MRQAERVRGVRLLGRDHAAARPLVGGRGSREHDGDDEAVPIHDCGPHVEIEAPIGFPAGLDQCRLEVLEAGDATEVHIEGGPTDGVVAAGRGGGETAEGDTQPHGVTGEGMETEHGVILRVDGDVGTRVLDGLSGSEWRRSGGVRAKARAVLGPAEETTSVPAGLRAARRSISNRFITVPRSCRSSRSRVLRSRTDRLRAWST